MSINISCFNTIHDIDKNLWNSIVTEKDIFHSYDFMQVTEDARVENSKFWYLLFYDQDKLVGSSVLSAFSFSLDLFIGKNVVVKLIKRLSPDFFTLRILVCGLPVSLGQRNLIVTKPEYYPEIIEKISVKMDEICEAEKIKFQTIKEFRESLIEGMDEATGMGFFKAFSIPYMILDITWKSFEEYVTAMRYPFRRQVKSSLKKLNRTVPSVKTGFEKIPEGEAELFLAERETCPPDVFFAHYIKVMERASTKLEILNPDFFKEFYRRMDNCMKLLVLKTSREILGAAILVSHGKELTFTLIGKMKEKDLKYDTYFNILNGIIEIAIEGGYSRLNLGQTSYWVKQRVGGIPENVFIYFKSKKKFTHGILELLNKQVFPALKLKSVNVFKKV